MAAHAAGVDGAHDVWLGPAGLGQRQRGARADDFGAVHVVVDDIGRPLLEQRQDGGQRSRIVGLVDDVDGLAGGTQAADGRSVGQADDFHVEAQRVQSLDQVLDGDLRATATAIGENLSHYDALAEGRAHAASRITRTRSTASSTAPHSYL